MFEEILFVIPARGGSKGLPGKNIKLFLGRPLIYYSIEFARLFVSDENICVSTDDDEIVKVVNEIGLKIQFMRPSFLATDEASTFDVLKHATSFYRENLKLQFKTVVLLQPTSPIREKWHLEEALALRQRGVDMVVSVSESEKDPYYTLFEENSKGFLKVCLGSGLYTRRQDTPKVYEYNGSIYVIDNSVFLEKKSFNEVISKKKYVMNSFFHVDIDNQNDWDFAEFKYKSIIE